MGTKVESPPPRNYGQETRDTLQAQVDLSPQLLKAEQDTRPAYTALELQTAKDALYGTGGQPGMVDLYEGISPRLAALERDSTNAQRESDIESVNRLGSKATEALRSSNPQAFALLDALTKGAQDDVASGMDLTEAERRAVNQSVRAGQSARGFGLGPSDIYQEAVATGEAGAARQAAKRENAMKVLALNQSLLGDPFLQILGRPSNTFAQTASLTNQGQGMSAAAGPQLFNPESQLASDIYNQNWQGKLAARTATANNNAALINGAMQMVGSFGSVFGG